jgi:hypothetical protein
MDGCKGRVLDRDCYIIDQSSSTTSMEGIKANLTTWLAFQPSFNTHYPLKGRNRWPLISENRAWNQPSLPCTNVVSRGNGRVRQARDADLPRQENYWTGSGYPKGNKVFRQVPAARLPRPV